MSIHRALDRIAGRRGLVTPLASYSWALLLGGALAACSGSTPLTPVSDDASTPSDAAQPDAVHADAGSAVDAGLSDQGPALDAGVADTGVAAPDATMPAPDAAGPPQPTVEVSGKLVDLAGYLAGGGGGGGGMTGVGGAALLTYGLSPQQNVVSGQAQGRIGDYQFNLPQNGRTILYASKQGYFPSYTDVATQGQNLSGRNVYIAPVPYVNGLATAYNVDLNQPFACHGAPEGGLDPGQRCVYGLVVGRILDDGTLGNGTARPVAGIAANDFQIVAGPREADWYSRGPYFLTATGTAAAGATRSITAVDGNRYLGGLFVLFVEVPAVDGAEALDVRISIRTGTGAAARYYGPTRVKAFRPYGVSWTVVPETGTPPPTSFNGVDFDTQIYPMLLPLAQGGYGCQGCHTRAGGGAPAAGMDLSGGPAMAYASLDPTTHMRRVNTADPPASLLLRKPLYETSGLQDHPIFAFASEQDPGYRTILAWISEGAQRAMTGPMVSFATDVRPILANPTGQGGAGCVACHGVALNPPGNFSVVGDAQALYLELTQERPLDNGLTGERFRINKTPGDTDRSLVLINPLSGNDEPHPVKIFSSSLDPRYVTIYRWIAQGYPNN